jgi:protein EFR3
MLYSHSVLTILNTVLRSNDINMIEESLPTFEAFCKHANSAALSADQQRIQQYLAVLELYASFAVPKSGAKNRTGESVAANLRWRTAGLRAIRAAVVSDGLNSEASKQLNMVMPVILQNMALDDATALATLQQRARTSEKEEVEQQLRRRLSSATVTTVDTTSEHLLTSTETAADADRAAEDEVKVLAVRCLKQIFSVGTGSDKGQTRLATGLTLKYIVAQDPPKAALPGYGRGNWATALFETVARWTPVQDRFIIVITAMETLVRSPILETLLEKQLVIATLIDWLLSSDINLIGLSIMDIMLGLVQHTLLLLQLGGRESKIHLHVPQTDTLGFVREAQETFDPGSVLTDEARGREAGTLESVPSPARQELLNCLQKCIAALSNHIYYTEQISDMMSAILARLKPSPSSDFPTITAAIEQPVAATKSIAESASLQEDPSTDSFFSFATARVTALKTVKDILNRASGKRASGGSALDSRARVGVQVWEGTQWLLKDEEAEVRLAYVDALLTWIRLETNKSDLLIAKDGPRKPKSSKRISAPDGGTSVSKRAVSNASRKEQKPARSTFLKLLHLAAYDSILDRAHNESDILQLYLLLSKLVERLGVNALRTGLPMILKLQETVLNGEHDLSSTGRVNIATLIHGYLWSIAEKFEFEASRVGNEINAEISRRKRFNIWLEKVKFPPLSIHSVAENANEEKPSVYADDAVGGLKPFLNVVELVDEIAKGYDEALLSPTQSPPASPGRVFSVPALGFGYGYGVAPGPKPSPEAQLPQNVKDEMGASWTRESCIAAAEKESAGSMTGTSSGPRHHLSVASVPQNDPTDNAATEGSPTYGIANGLGSLQKLRKTSANGSMAFPLGSTSSADSTLKVAELKRMLSTTNGSPLRRPISSRRSNISVGSDSLVSWNEADDRDGPSDVNGLARSTSRPETAHSRAGQKTSETLETNMSQSQEQHQHQHLNGVGNGTASVNDNDDDVPPVPKIPSNLNLPGTFPRDVSPSKRPHKIESSAKRTTSSSYNAPSLRGDWGTSKRSSRPVSRGAGGETSSGAGGGAWSDSRSLHAGEDKRVDVSALLAGIRPSTSHGNVRVGLVDGLGGGGGTAGGVGGVPRLVKPPY